MPGPTKSGGALFLGVELAVDQLRASLVDDSLELVGVECVDFDSEVSEYQTQGGIFTTPGEAYTTPVEMWIKALDLLLEKLHRNYDLTRIKSIGGCAQHALVWWKSQSVASLPSLDPHATYHQHFPASAFSLPNVAVAQDTSSHSHALAIEALLGGPDHMAARVGICADASMLAAQILRVREAWSQDVWTRTARVQLASTFMASLLTGKLVSIGEAEACATGMWVHGGNTAVSAAAGVPPQQGAWDDGVLDIVGGSRDEGRRVRGWLGEVDISGGSRRAGNVSKYLVERYGFDPETIVTPFTSDYLSGYLSMCPSPSDAVISFGPMDIMLTPAQHWLPTKLYSLFPHPFQDPNEKRRYIAALSSRNADVPRALVRDMYTKSWSAFDRLVAIVPPGGSIGLDDKLFSFWRLQGDNHPYAHVKGIFRFETGIKVSEFRDLRANPRCLIESQVLSFRVRWSRLISTGVLGAGRKGVSPAPSVTRPGGLLGSLGVPFDPYDHASLPTRILTTGAAANFPSVANLVGDVFNSPVFVPTSQVDSAQVVAHRNAPAQGYPGRPSLGSAFVARWVWAKERGAGGLGGFEEEMRRLLGKRWVATGGIPLRTSINSAQPPSAPVAPPSGSGSSTPYGARSGLGNTVFVEEDEDDLAQMEKNAMSMQQHPGVGLGMSNVNMYGGYPGTAPYDPTTNGIRSRTTTDSSILSSMSNSSSVPGAPSTAMTTPDLSLPLSSPSAANSLNPNSATANGNGSGGDSSATPTTPTPLVPVTAMPTADLEAQIGLAKVAEPDVDSFLSYAAIVPEFYRLEGMVVKGVVM